MGVSRVKMATSVAAGILKNGPGLATRFLGSPVLGAASLHTGAVSGGKHHWYPDKEFMRLYEGKALMYRSPAPRKNINIPETILPAHDNSPMPKEALEHDFYIPKEKYDPQLLPHTQRIPTLRSLSATCSSTSAPSTLLPTECSDSSSSWTER